MWVHIMDQSLEYSNTDAEVDRIFDEVEALLQDRGLYLSAVRVDSNEIYEDYKDYIIEHVAEIEKIEIVVHSVEELANQVLLSTDQYLERALPLMQHLPQQFYQGADEDSWNHLSQAVEGISWIYQMIQSIIQAEIDADEQVKFQDIINKFDEILPELISAIEARDSITIADTWTYEILPVINHLFDIIKNTIDMKVVRPDVS